MVWLVVAIAALCDGIYRPTNDGSVRKNERQLTIVVEIIAQRADLLVSEPRLQTVERHWLEVLVQLVGEEFSPSEQ